MKARKVVDEAMLAVTGHVGKGRNLLSDVCGRQLSTEGSSG